MKLNRSESREKIVTILYQIYMYQNNKMEYNIENVISENVDIQNDFINESVKGVLEKKQELFDIANKYLNNWDITRLSKVDQAIISLSIYELLYTETPDIICINEAIELGKKYSDDDVVKMINAILDKIYQNKIDK